MSFVTRRITKEIEKLNKDDALPYGITVYPHPDNILVWDATIMGGKDTPHEGLTYKLLIRVGDEYPTKSPHVKFISKIFHPNVYRDGQICVDTLQKGWTPTLKIISVLISIQSLLDDPNPSSPANVDAAVLYRNDKKAYKKKILEVYNSM